MNKVMVTVAGLFAVMAVVILAVGVWQLGWFVEKANTDKRSEIINDSFQRQSALTDELNRNIADVRALDVQLATSPDGAVRAQRIAIVTQACGNAGRLSGTVTLSANAAAFVAKECP